MFKKFINFYKTSSPIAPLQVSEEEKTKLYKKLRFQAFLAGTIGYSLYYVCRTSLNVVKKPILDSGALDATQLGIIGSSLLFAYAIGKFVNGSWPITATSSALWLPVWLSRLWLTF